ncbi:MetQ/NlpA family ABC transporter substrate-binding protein [Raoultibacter phocaeensis]|uniref:MetQ/NlpA family ABC transporter substrate-binding protein n=1 Tax=Raoultibacter phocaeensis TaxID=2479841 RepID=UPI00111A06E6|nr:MetQ/NlpA family ABC transporter substrate-binding protein [Raoultibacter phocaeensis]
MKLRNVLKIGLAAALACGTLGLLAGCGSGDSNGSSSGDAPASEDKVIKVGASPAPHAEILEQVKAQLADQGYTLEIQEFSDYVQPNLALSNGELDANYFQHITYLEDFDAERGLDLVSAGGIHFEPLCVYPGKSASFDDLPEGAQIAVPNDATNEARALLLLQEQGVITLKDGAGLTATKNDIAENPKNVEIIEAEAAALPRTLADVDLAVINGNYAIGAGLDPSTAIASEEANSEAAEKYVNVVAVNPADKDSEKIQALVKALTSDTVKQFIDSTYDGAVIATF